MKRFVILALCCSITVILSAQITPFEQLAVKLNASEILESVMPQATGNQFDQFDFNWDIAFEDWDSNGVTNVFAVDAGGGKTDVHVYSFEFDIEGNRQPLDRSIFFNMSTELLPDGEILDASRTTVFADSIHSSQYNEETGEFELAFVGYLTANANDQLATLEYLINGNLNDPPLGFIPFLKVNYYYDNEDRLSSLAQYFVNYYTFELELEDSTVIEYNLSDLPELETSFFSSGNIGTTRTAYYNDDLPMYQVNEFISADTLASRDSIFRTYPNDTDFQDDHFIYIIQESAYLFFEFTTFVQTDPTTTLETTFWFDGGGVPYATDDYQETFDEMDRLTTTLYRSTFVPGPLINEEMQVFVYPTSSGTIDAVANQLDILVKTIEGVGVEFEFASATEGMIEMISTNGVVLSSQEFTGAQHLCRLTGHLTGVYYFVIKTDLGNRSLGVLWKE